MYDRIKIKKDFAMENRRSVLNYFEDPNSNWKSEAEENIKRYRMGDIKIKLVDKNGNPIKNAQINVKQKNHEFKFGANLFMLDELETEEKNRVYKEKFKELFNMATLPFYWVDTEPEKGKARYEIGSPRIYRRPPVDLCLKFCRENGIEPREHALAYEHMYPTWLKGLSIEETKAEIEHHFKELGERYADKIHNIEVTNEMFWEKDEAVTSFYFEPDYIEWCFKTARKYFPENELIINEWTPNDAYIEYIKKNLEKGAPIDVVALQYHIFNTRDVEALEVAQTRYNPEFVIERLNKLALFGKPLEISEVTIPAFSTDALDEEIQAKLIENLYTLWFSIPSMEKIIYWNLVDGYAAFAPQGDMTAGENKYHGALLRFDLSEKPAYKKLKKLIHETWHTEKTLTTDENGEVSFRGFYGEYEIVANVKDKEIKESFMRSKADKNNFKIGGKI